MHNYEARTSRFRRKTRQKYLVIFSKHVVRKIRNIMVFFLSKVKLVMAYRQFLASSFQLQRNEDFLLSVTFRLLSKKGKKKEIKIPSDVAPN